MSIGTLLAYGTLRPNKGNTVTLFGYRMFSMGWYPAIVKGEPEDKVICERIEIQDEAHLSSLDMYEGCHGNTENCLYHRVKVGNDWVYVYNDDIDEDFDEEVTSGDWLDFKGQESGSNSRLAEVS